MIVNVVANVVAAAVLYLIASTAGVLTTNEKLQNAAGLVVAAAVALILTVAATMHTGRQGTVYVIAAALLLGGMALAVAVWVTTLVDWLRWALGVGGVLAMIAATFDLFRLRQQS
ncbi:hypothetical protein ACPCHT_39135 [Nucisporomicrobium flavum]|uniref:hypothetical protein n=1 Tax=Nucisporomicrobium flavum TaxID=2785915 RepID=UPI003C2E32E4